MAGENPEKRSKLGWWRVLTAVFAITLVWLFGYVDFGWFPVFVCINTKQSQSKNDLSQLIVALKIYNTEYGVLPTGDNAKIMAALRGDNARKIVFIECSSKQVNAHNEFLDPWKTPYRIDASNPACPWAYSCGANKLDEGGKWGSDDICSWQ